jgi:predicted Fe-S protein YdhL (DUF1289 family)
LNEDDVCLGCFRSLDEILQWRAAPELQKQLILELARGRKAEHESKYGSL